MRQRIQETHATHALATNLRPLWQHDHLDAAGLCLAIHADGGEVMASDHATFTPGLRTRRLGCFNRKISR